jgi:hypothetical protein
MLQIPTYYLLNNQIEKVMTPPETQAVVRTLKTNIPGKSFENMQISYAKDYIAYEEEGVLKVYNLEQEKEVFSKAPPSNDKNLGVLYFQWLPDRNTLIYFYARKNPKPVTTEVVPVTPDTSKSTQSESSTQTTNTVKTEDPQAKAPTPAPAPAPVQQQRVVTHYNNPQITDLYTLELPESSDTSTPPDDRFNESIDSFPAGGKITNMVVSTFTNLIYLTISSGTNQQLMEIDVMKNVRNLSRSGEIITKIEASDKFGTLYIESKTGKSKTIQALEGSKRQTISDDESETILGNRDGTLYLGKVEGNNLVQVRAAAETVDSTKLEFKTIWEGSIPFKDTSIIIGINNQIVIYSNQTAYILQSDGQEKQVTLSGKENFISRDGAELIEITPNGNSTDIELKPLE